MVGGIAPKPLRGPLGPERAMYYKTYIDVRIR